jgi:hypothetical protein
VYLCARIKHIDGVRGTRRTSNSKVRIGRDNKGASGITTCKRNRFDGVTISIKKDSSSIGETPHQSNVVHDSTISAKGRLGRRILVVFARTRTSLTNFSLVPVCADTSVLSSAINARTTILTRVG